MSPNLTPTSSLPTSTTIQQSLTHPLYTADSSPVTLSSILPSRKTTRVLLIFIRNFLCGNCQSYIQTLTTRLPPSSLPKDLSIVIIGCGAPSLLKSYIEITSCPYPIYTDPTGKLYSILGMQRSWSLGSKSPEYIQRSLMIGAWNSVVQGLKRIPTGDVWGAGDMSLNGGEFLFTREGGEGEEWKVDWCHRMRNTRDHTEIEDLKAVLGLGGLTSTEVEVLAEMGEKGRLVRRATTSKMQRPPSNRRQSWMHNLTRSPSTMRAGLDKDSKPKSRRFHSYSSSVHFISPT